MGWSWNPTEAYVREDAASNGWTLDVDAAVSEVLKIARCPCGICGKPIGHEVKYYGLGTADHPYEHAACVWTQTES